jgi:threonine dehydratase
MSDGNPKIKSAIMTVDLETIERAHVCIGEVLQPTPLQVSATFGRMAGCRVYLKPENLQRNGSFKIRGAANLLASLTPEERGRGVVTCSAGNWAQGVADAARRLGIRSLIVMPPGVSRAKLDATRDYGGEVELFEGSSLDLFERARAVSRETGMVYLDGFDNPAMIAGHGTIGLEILTERPDTDVVVVPVGGGALVSGIAMAAKAIKPSIRIVGVEPEGSAAMHRSLQLGRIAQLDRVDTIAEGLLANRPGERTFEIVRGSVDDIALVSEEEIRQAVRLLLERAKLLVEPSGAVSLAALLNGRIGIRQPETVVVAVLSGGNVDFDVLRQCLGQPPTGPH